MRAVKNKRRKFFFFSTTKIIFIWFSIWFNWIIKSIDHSSKLIPNWKIGYNLIKKKKSIYTPKLANGDERGQLNWRSTVCIFSTT